MPDKVTISHRGARYEIGRGKRFYGIWVTGAPASDPVDRWPQTRDGWAQAWARFTAIETPGTITAVSEGRAGFPLPRPARRPRKRPAARPALPARPVPRALAGAALLGLGVVLAIIGLFPGYVGSPSLAAQPDELVPHLLYLAVWAVSAVLIAAGARRARPGLMQAGTLLGTGLSAVTFGLFFSDLGEVLSGQGSLGAGLVLSLLGWVACAAGSALAFTAWPARRPAPAAPPSCAQPDGTAAYPVWGPTRPRGQHAGPIALLVLAAIGTAAAFVPSWDSYTLLQASTGAVQTVTAGNAFANPGPVIAGNVLVVLAVLAVAVLAAVWRPARQGAVLLAGAIVPLIAQAVSALIQVSGPMPSWLQAQASAEGLTISSVGVTPIFWVYCVFVISLVISCAWLWTEPEYPAMPVPAAPPSPRPADPAQSTPGEAGDSADSDDGAEEDEESTYA